MKPWALSRIDGLVDVRSTTKGLPRVPDSKTESVCCFLTQPHSCKGITKLHIRDVVGTFRTKEG